MTYFWSEEASFISLLGGHHLFYIFSMAGLLFLLITRQREVKQNENRVSRWILGISVSQQILLYSWYIFETGFDISESLPLHISRISSLLGIIFLLTKNTNVLDTLFYFGLYAYGSFFYPSRVYPAYHLMGISFFINHAVTILLPLFAAIAYGWRPTLKAAFRSFRWFLLYFFFVYFLNPLIDGNYFYLKYRPFFGDLPDTVYVPLVLIVTLVIFLLGYCLVKVIDRQIKTKKT